MRCFLDVLHLIYKDEVTWVSQCVGEFDHSVHFCDGFILAITVHIALYLFDLLCLSALFFCLEGHTTSPSVACLPSICVSLITCLLYTVYVPPQP